MISAKKIQHTAPQCRASVGSGTANAVFLHDPACENGIPERPQTLRYSENINIFSLAYAQSNAERILNRPAGKGSGPLVAIAGAAALVGVAGVRAAAVTLLVVVVSAAGVGVKDQRAGKISRRSAVGLAGDAAA